MKIPKPIASVFNSISAAQNRHQDRHRPTTFSFAIASQLTHLNVHHWDLVTATASTFLQRSYLTALQESRPEHMLLRYVLMYHDQRPIAAVACQLLTIDGSRLGLKKPFQSLHSRILICGNLFSWGSHGVAIVDGEDHDETWIGIGEALYRIRRSERLSGDTGMVLLKDIAQATPPAGLQRLGYRCFATEPDMRLEHSEKTRTFSDYLATMNAKYRKAAKDTFAAIDKGNCTVDVVTDLKEWDERFYALYLHVHHRATVRPTCIAPGYFSALARHLGPSHFRATIIQRDGRLLGFVTTIKDGDTAIGYMIGFDDQANDELPLYFRLLYATVEQGLAFGCRSLSLGRTALEAKSKLGAKPVSLHVAMRMKNPATNALIRPFLRWIPHAEAPDRTVFKA